MTRATIAILWLCMAAAAGCLGTEGGNPPIDLMDASCLPGLCSVDAGVETGIFDTGPPPGDAGRPDGGCYDAGLPVPVCEPPTTDALCPCIADPPRPTGFIPTAGGHRLTLVGADSAGALIAVQRAPCDASGCAPMEDTVLQIARVEPDGHLTTFSEVTRFATRDEPGVVLEGDELTILWKEQRDGGIDTHQLWLARHDVVAGTTLIAPQLVHTSSMSTLGAIHLAHGPSGWAAGWVGLTMDPGGDHTGAVVFLGLADDGTPRTPEVPVVDLTRDTWRQMVMAARPGGFAMLTLSEYRPTEVYFHALGPDGAATTAPLLIAKDLGDVVTFILRSRADGFDCVFSSSSLALYRRLDPAGNPVFADLLAGTAWDVEPAADGSTWIAWTPSGDCSRTSALLLAHLDRARGLRLQDDVLVARDGTAPPHDLAITPAGPFVTHVADGFSRELLITAGCPAP